MWGANNCKAKLFNQTQSYISIPITNNINEMRNVVKGAFAPTSSVNNGKEYYSINYENPKMPNGDWAENHWGGVDQAFSYTFYKPGFHAELMNDLQTQSQWTKYPFNYTNNFIETLDDINEPVANKKNWFVIAKSNSMHAIFSTGGLGWRNNATTSIAGFAGGTIASVSTVGPVIMTSVKGTQSGNPETLAEWRNWSTHHIAGADENGKYFGSARDGDSKRTVTKNGNQNVKIVVTGVIGPTNSYTAPLGAITGSVNYYREFNFDQSTGIAAISTLNSNGTDKVTELWESFPIHLYDAGINDINANPEEKTIISFYKNGVWVVPSTNLTSGVTAVRLMRYNSPVYIKFASPHKMKLSPNEMIQTDSHDQNHTRQVMVDLLNNNGAVMNLPTQTSIRYTINPVAP